MSFPVYVTQHVGTICLHIADIWHPFPFLFPNMCSSTSLAIRGLADKVVWRSIAYVFCCLHADPFLTLPLGWFPRNHPPAVHQCHACLAKFIDMQQDLPFQKYHKKKKKNPLCDDSMLAAISSGCLLFLYLQIHFCLLCTMNRALWQNQMSQYFYCLFITSKSLYIRGKLWILKNYIVVRRYLNTR